MVLSVPRPLQLSQEPAGELKENWRGSQAGKPRPQPGQEDCRLYQRLLPVAPDDDRAVAQFGGPVQAGLEAVADTRPADHAVDHHGDVVALAPGQLDGSSSSSMQLAVDQHAQEALLPQVVQQLAVLALAAAHHRRQQEEARALGQGGDLVLDGRQRAARGGHQAVGAVDGSAAGVEQAQEVVDLRHRAHGRARAAAQPLLVDGQGRRETLDAVDIGLGQLVEELVGVAGQALDVAALAFGVEGVEGQGGFSRPAGTGDDNQPAPGQAQADVLEVMDPDSLEGDVPMGRINCALGRFFHRPDRYSTDLS